MYICNSQTRVVYCGLSKKYYIWKPHINIYKMLVWYLALDIENGRYKNVPYEKRSYELCPTDSFADGIPFFPALPTPRWNLICFKLPGSNFLLLMNNLTYQNAVELTMGRSPELCVRTCIWGATPFLCHVCRAPLLVHSAVKWETGWKKAGIPRPRALDTDPWAWDQFKFKYAVLPMWR